ncbi:hypothetical protein [Piscibacillus halophilus]|uniref:Fluoroquinolone transport system permease protein n=1 Tax=Piscibacillus halophilus TaxID=571933 RepID=A0A1H9M9H9_9BACI|nr:hypothetical protein [Piscibacillus halophilus]SER20338.1 fluoroquinolone transport system permease protein [Piscibacillus halophilus]
MIKKILILSIGDIKNIQREPLLLFSLLGIFLLTTVVRYGLPVLEDILHHHTSFSLEPHFRIIVSLTLLMTPFMIGMLYGFIILDERDEGVLLYYTVTPIRKSGYLIARILAPIAVTFFASFGVILLQGLIEWEFITFILIALLLALQSPIITMMLASLASNKVEGLALIKVMNLMLIIPLIDYFIDHPMTNLTMIFPVYWPVKLFYENNGWFLLGGLIISLIWLILLNRLFRKRLE